MCKVTTLHSHPLDPLDPTHSGPLPSQEAGEALTLPSPQAVTPWDNPGVGCPHHAVPMHFPLPQAQSQLIPSPWTGPSHITCPQSPLDIPDLLDLPDLPHGNNDAWSHHPLTGFNLRFPKIYDT